MDEYINTMFFEINLLFNGKSNLHYYLSFIPSEIKIATNWWFLYVYFYI